MCYNGQKMCNYCPLGWFGGNDATAGCCSASTLSAIGCRWVGESSSGSKCFMINESEQS